MRIRFHFDEHIPASVAAGLRRRGIDVTTTIEAGLVAADDRMQLAFAAASERVLVTHDADFLRLHAQGVAHTGIAYCRSGELPAGVMQRRLALIHELLTPQEMAGRIEFL